MRCTQHRKDTTTSCIWCGKKLCPECIGKQDGRKAYCDKCVVSLAPFKPAEQKQNPRIYFQEPLIGKGEEPWTSKN